MAKSYTVNIANGRGSKRVEAGNYTVASNLTSYDNTTLTPSSVTINEEQKTFNFTVAGTSRFTVYVTDDGTVNGKKIFGAKFVRCDALGNQYGPIIISGNNGAVFNKVGYKFNDVTTVYIYYKQLDTVDERLFDKSLQKVRMYSELSGIFIANPLPPLQTFVITDANCEGLPVTTGTMTLSLKNTY